MKKKENKWKIRKSKNTTRSIKEKYHIVNKLLKYEGSNIIYYRKYSIHQINTI